MYGVARLVRKLLQELAARPALARTHRFVLYFNRHIPDDAFLDSPLFEKRLTGLARWGLPSSFSAYYYVLLPLRLWADRPDAMYWPNYMLPLIHPPSVPSLVMLTEDIWHQIHNPRLALRYRAAYGIFGTWAARTATRIMAISHASRDALGRLFGISPQRTRVNELGVQASAGVTPMPGTYVLFVGQAFERRRLKETIAAFEPLAARDPELRLIAIGPDRYDPPVIDGLVATANGRLGRPAIQHIQRVSDDELARFYAGARALVYVSDMEAFGLPPLEALTHGTPAVVADRPVNREVYGEHAFFVDDPSEPARIRAALSRALNDDAHRQAIRQAAPTIIARYTWAAHADRFLDIISSL